MKKFVLAFLMLFTVSISSLMAGTWKDTVHDTFNVSSVIRIMRDAGYSVSITNEGAIQWKIDGYKAFIFFDDDNEAIQFYIGFDSDNATVHRCNEFNKKYRYVRTYMNTAGDVKLEIDLSFTGGITEARLKKFLATCKYAFGEWKKQVVD